MTTKVKVLKHWANKSDEESKTAFAKRIAPKVNKAYSVVLYHVNRFLKETDNTPKVTRYKKAIDVVKTKIAEIIPQSSAEITIGDLRLTIPGNSVIVNGNEIRW